MPHNFKLTSGITNVSYVSKAGFDRNPDNSFNNGATNPNTPHRTLFMASYIGGISLVIGTGQYFQDTPVQWNNNNKYLIGDGKVIISGSGSDNSPTNAISITLENLEVTDYENLVKGVVAPYGGTNRTVVRKCILRRGRIHSSTDSNGAYPTIPLMADSICLKCAVSFGDYNGGGGGQFGTAIIRNIFIISPVELIAFGGVSLVPNVCYFDEASPLTIPAPAANYLPLNCNIRGGLTIEGVAYASLADAAVAWPALLTRGNINQDPRFNRVAAEDFTLKLSSPHLDLGIGPSHLRYSLMYYISFSGIPGDVCTVQNTKLVSTADGSLISFLEIAGFTVNDQGGLVIIANTQGNFEAYYKTDKIKVAATAQPITNLPVVFAANFNSDYPTTESAFNTALPEVYNNNVPAYNNYSSGLAGRNPHRHTLLARFTAIAFPNVDQSGDWVGNNYMEFEIGTTPTYNAATATGNGNPNFDSTPANVTQMVARYIQIIYRVRNNYYSQ